MEAPNAEEKREHERKREKEIKNELCRSWFAAMMTLPGRDGGGRDWRGEEEPTQESQKSLLPSPHRIEIPFAVKAGSSSEMQLSCSDQEVNRKHVQQTSLEGIIANTRLCGFSGLVLQ